MIYSQSQMLIKLETWYISFPRLAPGWRPPVCRCGWCVPRTTGACSSALTLTSWRQTTWRTGGHWTHSIHAIYSIILFRITLHYYSGSRHFNHLKRDTLIQITSDVEDPDPEKDRSDISGGFCLKKAIQSKYTTAINMFWWTNFLISVGMVQRWSGSLVHPTYKR